MSEPQISESLFQPLLLPQDNHVLKAMKCQAFKQI